EGEVGLFRDFQRRIEGIRAVARQTEDERAEHVDVVLAERTKTLDERLAALVEVLVDRLEAFFGDRLDADERALDVRALHRLQKLRILGRLHRYLRKEHCIV